MLQILYQDEYIIAINKPHGLLVHQSSIARDAEEFALQLLRDQIKQHVYPVHRLDRKTSGVLLFALNKEVEKTLHSKFANALVRKKYLAIVRGYTPAAGLIDYALRKENGALQNAVTNYHTLAHAELQIAIGQHPTSRYSLVQAIPETGRMHQLRKHFAHINHPIIGDRPHGCNKQNRYFKNNFNMDTMLLHASELVFNHPVNGQNIIINASLLSEFKRVLRLMDWE